MIDTATNKPVRVSNDEVSGPYIRVSVAQLDRVRAILDANSVPYWVEHLAISIDGKPAMTVINVGRRVDPCVVQAFLDSAA